MPPETTAPAPSPGAIQYARRHIARERAALPLFSGQLAETPDERFARLADQAERAWLAATTERKPDR